jgi:hypothetical protein
MAPIFTCRLSVLTFSFVESKTFKIQIYINAFRIHVPRNFSGDLISALLVRVLRSLKLHCVNIANYANNSFQFVGRAFEVVKIIKPL